MATIKFTNDDAFMLALDNLEGITEEMAKKAIYAGAKIVADAMKRNLKGVISDKSRTALVNSMGITPVKRGKNLNWNAHIGFDGYQKPGFGKFKASGTPFWLIARSFESGAVMGGRYSTSDSGKRKKKKLSKNDFWRNPKPFVAPAIRSTENEVKRRMAEVIQQELNKSMK